ncbi:MAG: ATP-binding protein, partial [Candidatus Binatia bacterium]|nr:ATP-binding protein [Candidatus Binatia bacterium]
LPIVRQIVEAHVGQVMYTSAPQQGTTFTVTFPLRSTEGGSSRGMSSIPAGSDPVVVPVREE